MADIKEDPEIPVYNEIHAVTAAYREFWYRIRTHRERWPTMVVYNIRLHRDIDLAETLAAIHASHNPFKAEVEAGVLVYQENRFK
jgi:acyl carrier protein phosphodiesterase